MSTATDRLAPPAASPPRTGTRLRTCLCDFHRDDDLARRLSEAGHEVTFCPLDRLPAPPVRVGGPLALQVSYYLHDWLRRQAFDLVCVADSAAPAYYSLLARNQGLALTGTTFCIVARQPTLYRLAERDQFLDRLDQLEADALERRCIELADAVLAPDTLLAWMRSEGWPSPRRIVDIPTVVPQPIPPPTRLPLVSVCLVHHDRPHFLRQALASLEKQDYPNFEIILVDDGSTTPAALTYLARIEPLFLARGWQLLRQSNRYLGAARNTAARHARGEYLLFMDDDNIAKPHEISNFVRAAEHSGADILTTTMDFFDGAEPPGEDQPPLLRWLFAGVDSMAGIARNCFGDANALVRRSTFLNLGGFTEEHGVTHEDWELFARAVLAGCKLEVVPDALFWYRRSPDSMIRTTSTVRNYARSLRPYLEDVPAAYRDLIRFAQGAALANQRCGLPHNKPLRYRIADAIANTVLRLLGRGPTS